MQAAAPHANDAPSAASAPPRRAALVVGGLLLGTAALGSVVRQRASPRPAAAPKLDALVPARFATWQEDAAAVGQVVNPQTQELLDKLYSEVLARSYVNDSGYRIMLSLAYGDDQRGGLQVHRPEACYPAQGFTLHSNVEASIPTPFGSIPGRRLETSLRQRQEPVTYWLAASGTAIRSRLELRWLEARLWLTGQVPDGLLFRVSSVDAEPARAFQWHDRFIADLLQTVSPADRARLSGLTDPGSAPT